MAAPGSHHVLRTLLVIVLLVVAAGTVEGSQLYGGIVKLRETGPALVANYATLEDQLENGDIEGAYASAQQISAQTGEIARITGSWPWDVAAALPVVGDDVKAARQLVDVMQTIGDSVTTPITDKLSELATGSIASGNAQVTLANLEADAASASELVDLLRRAQYATERVEGRLQQLKEANVHAPELARWIDQAAANVNELGNAFDQIDPALSGAEAVRSFIKSLVG